jgi:hypothetical protein
MTLLNVVFDIVSHDPHANAKASMMVMLDVEGYAGPYSALPATGTPRPGDIFPGAIVVMNANGKAQLADNDVALSDAPALLFTCIDGDQDLDGSFAGKVTCLQGGFELKLGQPNFVAAVYTPGQKLTVANTATHAGKFRAATSGEQIYGVVGSRGLDTTNSILYVIVPAGISPAA